MSLAALAALEQPPPRPGGRDVVADLLPTLPACLVPAVRARAELGLARYGEPLRTDDGRHAAADLVQELLDALVYAHRLKMMGWGNGELQRDLVEILSSIAMEIGP